MIDPVIVYVGEGLLAFVKIVVSVLLFTIMLGAITLTVAAGWRIVYFARVIWRVPRHERRDWVTRQLGMMRERRKQD